MHVHTHTHNRDEKGRLGGELIFGGTDPNHFIGSLSYVKLLKEDYWSFMIDRLERKGSIETLMDTLVCVRVRTKEFKHLGI